MRNIRVVSFDQVPPGVPGVDVGMVNRRFLGISAIALIEDEGQPVIGIYLCGDDHNIQFRKDALIWRDYAVIGGGDYAAVVNLEDHSSTSIPLGCYFGYLYSTADVLLITSAQDLYCIGIDGQLRWKSGMLGVDGVQVLGVEDEIISGVGDVDPPFEWKPFKLSLATGNLL